MKNLSFLKQFLAIGALLLIITSCGKKDVEVDTSEQQFEIDETALPAEPAHEVARIQKDGHEYIFEVIGEGNDIVVLEKLYGEAEESHEETQITEEATPFEVFISLTDENVKVPLRIAATVDESTLASSNREINESSSPLEILDSAYSVWDIEDRGCYDVGWTNFYQTYCGGQGMYYPLPQERKYCDRGTKIVLSRHSGDLKCKKVKTWTNSICGNTLVTVWSTRDPNGGGPMTRKYQKSFPNGIWYLNYYSGASEYRRVHRTVTTNNTKFRAFTKFMRW